MSEPGPRLLIVEDEEHLAFSLEFNLAEEGFQVDLSADVAAARARPLERYDLFILDVMLPDGNGIELCRELRQRGVLAPVLFLTAKDGVQATVAGLEAGGDDYLAKPFVLEELLGRIGALLRRQRWQSAPGEASKTDRPQAGSLSFGDVEIDFGSREAQVRGEPTRLTELEARLMRYFSEHEGEVVSRQQLLQDVWNISPRSQTRTVDNFVVRLRRLFERDASRPRHLLTIRGAGYRFVR